MNLNCIHRQKPDRIGVCTICPNKGKAVDVHGCDVFGECTIRAAGVRGESGRLIKCCLSCPDRLADPAHLPTVGR